MKYLAIFHSVSIIDVWKTVFLYLSRYSLSEVHSNTGRLIFEFNRLQCTLAAPEVFVALQILLVCRPGTGSASSETQTLTRSKPHPYGIASYLLDTVEHAYSRLYSTVADSCTSYTRTPALGLIGGVCLLQG